jgi:hypothetical protein
MTVHSDDWLFKAMPTFGVAGRHSNIEIRVPKELPDYLTICLMPSGRDANGSE